MIILVRFTVYRILFSVNDFERLDGYVSVNIKKGKARWTFLAYSAYILCVLLTDSQSKRLHQTFCDCKFSPARGKALNRSEILRHDQLKSITVNRRTSVAARKSYRP